MGLVLLEHLIGERYKSQRRGAWLVLALGMVFAWSNFGQLRGGGNLVHQWEQFHFYLGAKYQQELGWFDLYPAVLVADREGPNALAGVRSFRDCATFELVPVQQAFDQADRIKKRFTLERWAAFTRDWGKLLERGGPWAQMLTDHGNSNSPAWALFAHPIAWLLPLEPWAQTAIGWLDMVLMGVVWAFIYTTFGVRSASIGLVVASAAPNVFDYLAGSFLRWDWFFAMGMAACFLERKRFATAGAFFGYAVASKLFPIFFGVALLVRAAWLWRGDRTVLPRYLRFGVGSVASALVCVAISTAMFGSDAWSEYKRRIDAARVEKFYAIQYSLRTVYLQVAESSPGELAFNWLYPREIKQALPRVDIAQHEVGFLLVRLLFTVLIAAIALRSADDVSAFLLGPMLVFTWLTVNMYYWNMLGLLALGLSRRKDVSAVWALLSLPVLFILYFQRPNHGMSDPFAVAVLMATWIVLFGGDQLLLVLRAPRSGLAPNASSG
jgi:hypothetical protein